MKKNLYILNHISSFVFINICCVFFFASCQKDDSTESTINNKHNLPALHLNNETTHAQLYSAIYSVIEFIDSDEMLCNLVDEESSFEDWGIEEFSNSEILSDLVETTTYQKLDSICNEFFLCSLEELDIISSTFNSSLQSLLSDGNTIEISQIYSFLCLNDLTDGEIWTLYFNCAIHNYIIDESQVCFITLYDGNNRLLDIFLKKELYNLPYSNDAVILNVHDDNIYNWSHAEIPSIVNSDLHLIDTTIFESHYLMLAYISQEVYNASSAECYATWMAEYRTINEEYANALSSITQSVGPTTNLQSLQSCIVALTAWMETQKAAADRRLRECLASNSTI